MGGGAGINFSIKLEGGYCHWHPRKRAFHITKPPTIERFDALGYMDGMRDVRGDLLRVTDFEIQPLDPADADWLKRHGVRASQHLYICCSAPFEAMVFGGYLRGDIRSALPSMSFTGDVEIEGVGAIASFGLEATEEFFQFYEDVFDFIAEEPEVETCKCCGHRSDNLTQIYEDHFEDCRANYQIA